MPLVVHFRHIGLSGVFGRRLIHLGQNGAGVLLKLGHTLLATEINPSAAVIGIDGLIDFLTRYGAFGLGIFKQNTLLGGLLEIFIRVGLNLGGAHVATHINSLALQIEMGGTIDRLAGDKAGRLGLEGFDRVLHRRCGFSGSGSYGKQPNYGRRHNDKNRLFQ
jgi:hypothetical protein